MFKKTMTFENLQEEEVTQTFYFSYNKREVAELLEFGHLIKFPPPAGETRLPLEQQLEMLSTSREESGLSNVENNKMAYAIFQGMILDAYGEKADDNVRFIKDARTRAYMENHVAFDDLIFEFIADTKLAGEFIESCLPARLVKAAKEELANQSIPTGTLQEMTEEAERRQQDPETRIEPGPEAAAEAIGTTEPPTEAKKPENLTATDIENLSDEDFAKLDPKRLQPDALVAAFRRKNQ